MPALAATPVTNCLGVDFTSAPTKRKPITVAHGSVHGARVSLQRVDALDSFAAFEVLLREAGPWVGAFDFPFGLPRELVEALDWPREWQALMRHYAALSRPQIRTVLAAFCAARPVGGGVCAAGGADWATKNAPKTARTKVMARRMGAPGN